MSIKRLERKLEKIEKRPCKHEQRFRNIHIRYRAYLLECYLDDDKEIDEENSAVKAYKQAEKNPRFRKYIKDTTFRKKYEESKIDKYITKKGD